MFVSVGTIRQALTILPASLCVLSVGIGYGWTAPTIKQLRNFDNEFALTTEECSCVASLPEFFRAIGTALVFLTVDTVGRKKLYFLCPVVFAISWSMVLLYRRSIWLLYGGRSIFGLAMGITDAVSIIYVAESSSPQLRGIFGSLQASFYCLGTVVAYGLSAYLSYTVVVLVNLVSQFWLMLFVLILIKEPTQYLIMKGRYNEAEKVFCWQRASKSAETKFEYEEMVKNIPQKLRSSSPKEILSRRPNRKSLKIVFLMNVLIALAGTRTISSFVTTIFSRSTTTIYSECLTVLCGLIVLASAAISSLFIEYFNRRTILITGLLGSSATLFVIAILYYWQENIFQLPHFGWIIFSGIAFYFFLWSLTVLPICGVISGELLVQNVKPFGLFLTISATSMVNFVLSLVFLQAAETYGIYFNFLFFSSASLTAVVYVCACLPETRGKSLVAIQKMFEN